MAELNLEIPKLKLNDGVEIPMLAYGLGTAWFKRDDDGKVDRARVDAVKLALRLGYTHLDGAEAYNTEREMGVAIRESGVPRDRLFVTGKVKGESTGDIVGAARRSLGLAGLDHFDLYLIHDPFWAGGDAGRLGRAWRDMEAVKAAGLARSIGVSNFSAAQVDAVLAVASVPPSINQTEFHPYLQRGDLQAQLEAKGGIKLAAYGPLAPVVPPGKPGPLDDMLAQLARKYAVNEGEIVLRWVQQRGIVAARPAARSSA